MGVLRIKDDVDALLETDPYELFSLDEAHHFARGVQPRWWATAAGGVVLAFGVAALTLWRAHHDAKTGGEQPYAYFEIRAIDPDGRPVTGALVRQGEHQLGVTDSFGEWRRFMRVKPGSTMMLQVSKKSGDVALSATKNIAVPLVSAEGGDLELKGSVQLSGSGAKAAPAGVTKGSGASVAATGPAARASGAAATLGLDDASGVAPTTDTISAESATPGGSRPTDAEPSSASGAPAAGALPATAEVQAARRGGNNELEDPTMAAEGVSAAAASPAAVAAQPRDGAATPADALAARVPEDDGAVWVMAEGRPTDTLRGVVAALRKHCRERGLRVEPSAGLQVRVAEIPALSDGARLLKIDGLAVKDGRGTRLFSFLRNGRDDALQTARVLAWAMTARMAKTYRVARQGDGSWTLDTAATRIWPLAPGQVVYDASGLAYNVAGSGQGALRLVGAGTEPCAAGASCAVTAPGLGHQPPVRGWHPFKMQVLGDTGADTLVFVAGYEARRLQDHVYEYWGAPATAANVTVIRGGRLLYRGRVQARSGAVPSVTLPSLVVSRR